MTEPQESDEGARRNFVLASLEEDQLVAAKAQRLGRARLSPGARLLMWGLRIYVLAMFAVIVYVVVHG